ncbi:MAG TPA: hypothetical protein VFX11_13960 [Candidatus Kapabacteria bacterium]|nr:hypothetical protein [Candidatus Kapabacteria bacterium]
MLASKMNIDLAVHDAQQWTEYEGVSKVMVAANRRSILVVTSCNPAAITAPIPSFFHGFQVQFHQSTQAPQTLES